MLLSLLTSTDVTEISDRCWNSTDILLDSEQILVLQISFLCSFSFHNLFSSPTATEPCYSGLHVTKEGYGRWDYSIFNAFREKNARACRVHVRSNSGLSSQTPQKCGKLVPQEGGSCRRKSSKSLTSGARKLSILLGIYEAFNLIFCKSEILLRRLGKMWKRRHVIYVLICRDTESDTLHIMTRFTMFIYPLTLGVIAWFSDQNKICLLT